MRAINRPADSGRNALGYDETSIDLHLDDTAKAARVWDMTAYREAMKVHGRGTELLLGSFQHKHYQREYLKPVPKTPDDGNPVFARGDDVIVRPQGFLLWTTLEWVGTPETNPHYICFVNAKSTKARTGVVVHLTAPTIQAGWQGNIVLEIVNFGPFDLVLKPGDAIAQLVVAQISSPPNLDLKKGQSATAGQTNPGGKPIKKSGKK